MAPIQKQSKTSYGRTKAGEKTVLSFPPADRPVTARPKLSLVVTDYGPIQNPQAYTLVCRYCDSRRSPLVANCKNCGASKGKIEKL